MNLKIKYLSMIHFSALILILSISSCRPENSLSIIKGKTYYISSVGDDTKSGTSPEEAWNSLNKVNQTIFKSGDSILFHCGDRWEGQLFPKGSGVESSPIVMSSFGNGEKPHIAANGINGLSGGALVLDNQDYWVVEKLQFSNSSPNHESAIRYGVLISWHDYGTGHNVRIANCDIHDVDGIKSSRFKGDGIYIEAGGNFKPTNYDGIVIEKCSIKNISRSGICLWSTWNKRGGLDYGPSGSTGDYFASKNVLIKGNYLENIGGDGILVSCNNGAKIEYNRVFKANANKLDPNAGIWPHNSDNVIMQYNEVSNTFFSGDGQGFDIDLLCSGCLVQYNYSHDNDGGFLLICSDKSGITERSIVRYNISQNDKRHTFYIAGSVDLSYIYNNTIYLDDPTGENGLFFTGELDGGVPENIFFDNNIVYINGIGKNTILNQKALFKRNNCWFGSAEALRLDPTQNGSFIKDPQLVDPGKGTAGIESLKVYQLQHGSPCRTGGMTEPNNGGRDFFGNPVSKDKEVSIGAHQVN